MTPIRFAIWAAVSTKDQALDDKASLRVQEDECRRVATSKGWEETAGPYIVRGQSRTRWVSLRDAENNVPELHAMLDAAQARQFDVLMVKDYDRFRDILDQVFRTINDYRVQLYSLAQAIEPAPPEQFDPEASDSQELLISFSQLRSRTEIRTTRRRYRAGMPDRITRYGIPVRIPFGYRKPLGREADRRAVPEQIPEIVPHLIAIKDLFLAGQSMRQLAEYLTDNQVLSARGLVWNPYTVREMITNPFYAGIVRWGVSKNNLDRRTGRYIRSLDPEQAITATGAHVPLWDYGTYLAIMAEFARRAYRYSGKRANTLSGLLTCGICNHAMWLHYTRQGQKTHDPTKITWHCGSREKGHPSIKNRVAIEKLIIEIKRAISLGFPAERSSTSPDDPSAEILALVQRRARIRDAYDAGDYSITEMRTRTAPIDAELARLKNQIQSDKTRERETQDRSELMATLASNLDNIDRIFQLDRMQDVNHALKTIIYHITVVNAESIVVEFKKL